MTTTGNHRATGSRTGRFRSRVERIIRHPATDVGVLVLILASVTLVLVEAYAGISSHTHHVLWVVDIAITGCFAVELSARWFTAPSTRRHFQEYWLDWLAVIPPFRVARALRIIRLLRAARLFRLYRFGVLAQHFVAKSQYHHFEQILRAEVAHYRGRFADQVWLAPDVFRMLGNLLDDGRLSQNARQLVLAAMGYFISPFEIFPRELYGAEGYVDQVYLCLWTVNRLRDELPDHVLEEAWDGEGDILRILTDELPTMDGTLGAEELSRLEHYVGLSLRQAQVAQG